MHTTFGDVRFWSIACSKRMLRSSSSPSNTARYDKCPLPLLFVFLPRLTQRRPLRSSLPSVGSSFSCSAITGVLARCVCASARCVRARVHAFKGRECVNA
eukprot:5884025-Pleurochrysis_carterae.AAC.2